MRDGQIFYVCNNLSSFEKKVLKILKNSKIDMICLAGFMKILSKFFIKEFGNPILNIHPYRDP